MMHAHAVGKRGEALALDWLVKQGYVPVESRYKRRGGELDLIVRRGQTYVFVEVKTRHEKNEASSPEDLHPAQVRRLASMIESYVVRHDIEHWMLWLICVRIGKDAPSICRIDLTESLDLG